MSGHGKPDKSVKRKDKGRRKRRRPESAMFGGYDNAMKQGAKARKNNGR